MCVTRCSREISRPAPPERKPRYDKARANRGLCFFMAFELLLVVIVKALAGGGWLRNAVPDAGGRLDVRTLCLTRETLARRSGLADFVFAMQGLGSGPISLFGTEAQKAARANPEYKRVIDAATTEVDKPYTIRLT